MASEKTTSEIVYSENGALILDSGLTASAFGKTNMGTILDEQGWIANIRLHKNAQDSISFSPYSFESTETKPNRHVVYIGPEFKGQTLHSIFSSDSNESCLAGYAATAAITSALEQNISITATGTGGIIYKGEKTSAKKQQETYDVQILFLPGYMYERCALNTSDSDYSNLQGQSIRRGLEGDSALAFTRAVIAYRTLCGKMPYTEINTDKRQADILDANFTPCELVINGLNSDVAHAINSGLKISGTSHTAPGERNIKTQREIKQEEEEQTSIMIFPLESFKAELNMNSNSAGTLKRKLELPPSMFESKRTRYLARRKAAISFSRFTRRNRNMILAAVIAIIVSISIAHGFHKENEKLATSIGLTSSQTVETLYTGINNADVTIVQEVAKGGKMKDLIQMVSGFYITAKQRQSLNQEDGTVSPAEWIFFKGSSNFWLYGITNFVVDGKEASSDYKYPTRKNHPPAINGDSLDMNSKKIKRGTETSHTSSYYLVHSDSDSRININYTTDTVTLKWKGNRWVATKISGTSKNSTVNTKTFRSDYTTALEESGGDIEKAAEIIRKSYPWLPRTDELSAGAEKMVKKYNNTAAKEYLEK